MRKSKIKASKRKASTREVMPDRLSELPDSILLHILSLLYDLRDVVKTTLISKRWENLWTTIPYLDFWDESPKFISDFLAQWRGAKILKFGLEFACTRPLNSDIDSWLLFAIEKKVEDVCIDVGRYKCMLRDRYCPPQSLYSCSSITKLSLFKCELKIEENVQWNHLKSLTIECERTLSEEALNHVLTGAPQLEELYLSIYEISENFNIRSRTLKILQIGMDNFGGSYNGDIVVNSMLRIWAPNLLTLKYFGFSCCNCLLDVPSLTEASFYVRQSHEGWKSWDFSPFFTFNGVFRSICHVEKVILSAWCIKCLVCMKKEDMIVPLSNAKFLKLHPGDAEEMLEVLEMFPKLTTLIVELDQASNFYLKKVTHVAIVEAWNSLASKMAFSCPSLLQLKTVEISWWLRAASIIPAIEILLKNAHVLENMVLRLGKDDANPKMFGLAFEKLLSMPRSSPYAKVMITRRRY